MDVTNKLFLLTKDMLQGKKGRRSRRFFHAEEIEKQKARAVEYTEDRGDDFLIVRVIEQIHVEDAPDVDRVGAYLLVNKHKLDKDDKPYRRTFFDESDIETHRKLGHKYALENQDDFLIVQVVLEISATMAAKKRARDRRK